MPTSPNKSMKRIYIARHGETAANAAEVVCGKDESLNDTGRMQAAQLAERTQQLDIAHLIASEYVRAQQTIAPTATVTGLTPEINEHFGEMRDRSDFHGLHYLNEQVQENWSIRNERAEVEPDWKSGDEETISELFGRIIQARKYLETHEADTLFIVSHGFYLSCFMSHLLLQNQAPSIAWITMADRFKFSNTGVSYLTYEPEKDDWKIVMLNDHAHFAE